MVKDVNISSNAFYVIPLTQIRFFCLNLSASKTYNMKAKFIILISLISTNLLLAQNKSTHTININHNDIATDIKPTSDGGYIIIGSTGPVYDQTQFVYMKVDSEYNPVWTHTISNLEAVESNNMIKINETEFIINAYYNHQTEARNSITYKINEDGEILADFSISGETNDYWRGLSMDSSGENMIYYGKENNQKVIKKTDFDNNAILTINPDLFILNVFENQSEIITMAQTPYVDPPFFNYLDLIKYDSLGNQLWHHQYGNYKVYSGKTILPTPDNGILFVGSSTNYEEYSNLFLYKTDADGNEQWQKTISTSYLTEKCYDAIIIDTYLYATGYKWSESDNNNNAILVKFDLDGNQIWYKEYPFENYKSEIIRIIQKNDDRLIMVGFKSERAYPAEKDFLIIETDLNGLITSTSSIEKPYSDVKISPNPAQEFIYLDINNGHDFDELRIYNTNGVLVSKQAISERIDLSHLPSGNYLIQLSGKKNNHIEKIIIQ